MTPKPPVGLRLLSAAGSVPLWPIYVGRGAHGENVFQVVVRRSEIAPDAYLFADEIPAGTAISVRIEESSAPI